MGFHARKLCSLKTIEQIEQNHSRQLYHQILKKKFQPLTWFVRLTKLSYQKKKNRKFAQLIVRMVGFHIKEHVC